METSKPLPYEQALPTPEKTGDSDTLPPPVELNNSQEGISLPGVERPQLVKESEFARQAVRKRPEAVMAHVVEAANKGEAQEAVYELRHEIKDDPSTPMVSVGSVVADIPERQPAMAKSGLYTPKSSPAGDSKPEELPHLPGSNSSHFLSVYRGPMLAGFVSALVAVSLYIIFRLIIR